MATSALDRVRQSKRAAFERLPICMDSEHAIRLQKLDNEVNRLRAQANFPGSRPNDELSNRVSDLEDELESARADALEHSEWFEVRALQPDAYQRLLDQHAPSKDQIKEARRVHGPKAMLEYNIETFPSALIAACTWILTKTGQDEDGPIFDSGEQLTPEFVAEMKSGPLDPDTGEPTGVPQWNNGEIVALFNTAYNINQSTGNINAAGNG